MARTIVVDPGHSGSPHDPGAIGAAGTHESALNLTYAQDLAEALERAGYAVVLTRRLEGVRAVSLAERVAISNDLRPAPALFLSIHMNACGNPHVAGFEVLTSVGETPADGIATAIHDAVKRELASSPSLVRLRVDYADGDPDFEAHLYVLRHTKCPAVLVECGFLSNPDEESLLRSPAHRKRLLAGIVRALREELPP